MEWQVMAEYRAESGKNAARRLRRAKRVPGVLYGYHVKESLPISLDAKDVQKLLAAMGEETKVLHLSLKRENEEEQHQVLIREVQTHPFKRRLLHVDLYALAADQLLDVDVPIEIVGESPGIKKGGVVEQLLHALSVRCLPHEIPDKVAINVGSLDLGGVIHVKDVKGRFSFRILDDDDAPIVSVNVPADYESKGAEGETTETE